MYRLLWRFSLFSVRRICQEPCLRNLFSAEDMCRHIAVKHFSGEKCSLQGPFFTSGERVEKMGIVVYPMPCRT